MRTWRLPAGPPVRVRLARPNDAPAVRDLLARRGLDASPLELRRLLTFDPVRRAVLCALAPIDGRDTLVGIGAIDLFEGAEPDTLVIDERLTEGLGGLLGELLLARANTHARLSAA